MFNWFRRKTNKTEAQEVTKSNEQATSPQTETANEEANKTPDDYLSWAKSAYKNIQQRQTTTTETLQETVKDDQTITEAEPEIPETSEPSATSQESTPAWMQKSDRLEVLKETAIETETVEDTTGLTFDEEFVWSAKVLAAQGRAPDDVSQDEINWLKRLRQGLGKSRRGLVNQLKSIVGQGPLNEDAVMEIEALLLQADTGIEATDYIISTLQNQLLEEALPPEQALEYLKTILREILDRPLQKVVNPGFAPEKEVLNIWLLTGVNGAGKTTTIGKLAHLAQQSGYNCIIAAADTFRAAAVEQVKVWGERTNTPVIANPGQNTDPAAVVFDGISAAQARNVDLLLVDTAGRLQNKKNLMAELAKIRRIIDKKAANAQVESLLVLDATLGQNGLRQAEVFSEAANLSGVVLTKLDGTAKGGVALAVAQQLNLPIRFIGVGEGIEDLRPFSSYEFVEALLNE
ncbi:MAG: signal recognition particle-docking protein FtsY [Crocosphaera sp.]